MVILEAQKLSKHYPGTPLVRAVDGVDLTIERSSLMEIHGPSGSGKTTLLALLGALERPTSGEIRFDGTLLTRCSGAELTRVRQRIGFIFQDFALIPNLTAQENILYPLLPRGLSRHERLLRAGKWLERFEMSMRSHVRAGQLSGGEQQRIAIARALAGQPDVILADEPTSNLDDVMTTRFVEAIHEFRDRGGTVVLASHDPRLHFSSPQRLVMNRGRRSE